MKRLLIATLCAGAACAADEAPAEKTGEANGEKMSACPVIDSREWSAWIDAMPGPDAPSLHIRGTADLPTPGYSYSWREGIADRAMPPGVHFHLDFTAPDGMVAQVVTPTEVAYKAEAAYSAYRVIYVHCGEETLAEITDIQTAQ